MDAFHHVISRLWKKESYGKKRKLPMGIEDFERIQRDGFYYVDKTRMIRDLLENIALVNLFTRLRRFGKTLNMSMLKHFFRLAVIIHCLTGWKFQGNRNSVTGTWENFRLFPSA